MTISIFIVVAVSVATATLLGISQWRVSQQASQPMIAVNKGLFDQLAARSLGPPEDFLQVLPPVSANTSKEVSPRPFDEFNEASQTSEHVAQGLLWGAAAADGLIPAAEVWARWASVDNHVFDAVAHLTHEQIGGVADLLNVVDAHKYPLESAGFFNNLLGHLGEWPVGEHLINAGAAVSMPLSSNHPGLDLWVDGNPVNVKTVADAASLGGHFSTYPDIPVFVPFDAANIPADALHFNALNGFNSEVLAGSHNLMIVDDALSHADMAHQTRDAIDVLNHPGPHLHFPYITIAVSSFREIKLLAKGHTECMRAAKNVVTDAAAVGGGGLAGMKAGALVGTLGGPVGTVVGGIIGGFLGALGGRAIANEIKTVPLNEAREKYDRAMKKCVVIRNELLSLADAELLSATKQKSDEMAHVAEQINAEADAQIATVKADLHGKVMFDLHTASKVLEAAGARIKSLIKSEKRNLRKRLPFWAVLFPGMAFPAEVRAIRQLQSDYRSWRSQKFNVLRGPTQDVSFSTRCMDLVLASPDGLAEAQKFLIDVHQSRQLAIIRTGEIQQTSLSRILTVRAEAVTALKEMFENIKNRIEAEIAPQISKVKERQRGYEAELRSAGVSI
jgi:hypothetical protein